jgi:3-phytase
MCFREPRICAVRLVKKRTNPLSGTRRLLVFSGLAVVLVLGIVVWRLAASADLTATPVVETASFPNSSGDIADDSAIWVNDSDPSASLVIADNKSDSGGGVGVFNMSGSLVSFLSVGKIGNVDLRRNFSLGGQNISLVGGNNRSNNTLELWKLDPATGTLTSVAARTISTSTGGENYGFCMYRNKISGKTYAFVTPIGSGNVQQFELFDNGAGKVDATSVRTLPINSITEACVADDDLGHLYLAQEEVSLWKYNAEPTSGTSRTAVATVDDGHVVEDLEGVSIAYGADGTGYIILSSQGDSTYAVYDRAGNNAFLKSFTVGNNGTIDAATGTDGLDVTSSNLGGSFTGGMLVVHDGSNSGGTTSNLKYVSLSQIVAVQQPPRDRGLGMPCLPRPWQC